MLHGYQPIITVNKHLPNSTGNRNETGEPRSAQVVPSIFSGVRAAFQHARAREYRSCFGPQPSRGRLVPVVLNGLSSDRIPLQWAPLLTAQPYHTVLSEFLTLFEVVMLSFWSQAFSLVTKPSSLSMSHKHLAVSWRQ